MEPSQLYEEYKSQFINNCELLQVTSDTEDPTQYQKLINQNTQLLKHISIELCSLGSKMSSQENRKIQPFKKKFLERKKQWQSSSKHLMENTQRISYAELQQNEKLSQSKQLLYEMEDTSLAIGENLQAQTEKLRNTTQKVKTIDKVLDSANTLVDKMITRQNRRKYLTYFVLAVVILIIGMFKVYSS